MNLFNTTILVSALINGSFGSTLKRARLQDSIMKSCYNLNQGILLGNINQAGVSNMCFKADQWSLDMELSSLPYDQIGLTPYEAIFKGFRESRSPESKIKVRAMLRAMWHKGVLVECPGTSIVSEILWCDLGYDLAIESIQHGAKPVVEQVFKDLKENKDDVINYIKAILATEEGRDYLQNDPKIMQALSTFADEPNAIDLIHLLLDAGVVVDAEAVYLWILRVVFGAESILDAIDILLKAIPNPFMMVDGHSIEEKLDAAIVTAKNEYRNGHGLTETEYAARKAAVLHSLKQARDARDVVLVPEGRRVTIQYKGTAQKVVLTGDFDNWKQTIEMKLNPETGFFEKTLFVDYALDYGFKFVVDGTWVTSVEYPVVKDYKQNVNNLLLAA